MCSRANRCCTACADALTGRVKWRSRREDQWLQPDAGHHCRLGKRPEWQFLLFRIMEKRKRAGVSQVGSDAQHHPYRQQRKH
jgi:hypothetical protein